MKIVLEVVYYYSRQRHLLIYVNLNCNSVFLELVNRYLLSYPSQTGFTYSILKILLVFFLFYVAALHDCYHCFRLHNYFDKKCCALKCILHVFLLA